MKMRFFCSLAVAFALFTTSVFAQTASDLVGTWKAEFEDDEDEDFLMACDYDITFESNSNFSEVGTMHITMKMDEETTFETDIIFSCAGTFVLDGDIIKYTYDPKSTVVKEGKGNIPGILRGLLIKPLLSELKKEKKKTSSDRIVSLEGNVLTLLDLNDDEATPTEFVKK